MIYFRLFLCLFYTANITAAFSITIETKGTDDILGRYQTQVRSIDKTGKPDLIFSSDLQVFTEFTQFPGPM